MDVSVAAVLVLGGLVIAPAPHCRVAMVPLLPLAGCLNQDGSPGGELDTIERRIGDVTVRIDRLLCVGFETCLAEESSLFAIDDEGIAIFHAQADTVAANHIIEACRACPVDALEVLDGSGARIVP